MRTSVYNSELIPLTWATIYKPSMDAEGLTVYPQYMKHYKYLELQDALVHVQRILCQTMCC